MQLHTLPERAALTGLVEPPQDRATSRRRPWLAVALRALMLLGHVLAGFCLALLIRLADAARLGHRIPRERIAGGWHRGLLRILDVRIVSRGTRLRTPHLLVSNHVSWLDIPVLGACSPVRFVSRHDVQRWPVAGTLANACGTLYLHRGAGQAHFTADAMRAQLACGAVALFPEGTTSDGTDVLPFRARLFQTAIDAGVPVQPVALRYGAAWDGRFVAPFVGDDDLLRHLLRLLRAGALQVEVRFFASLVADEQTERSALAAQAQRRIQGSLQATCRRPATGDRYQ